MLSTFCFKIEGSKFGILEHAHQTFEHHAPESYHRWMTFCPQPMWWRPIVDLCEGFEKVTERQAPSALNTAMGNEVPRNTWLWGRQLKVLSPDNEAWTWGMNRRLKEGCSSLLCSSAMHGIAQGKLRMQTAKQNLVCRGKPSRVTSKCS